MNSVSASCVPSRHEDRKPSKTSLFPSYLQDPPADPEADTLDLNPEFYEEVTETGEIAPHELCTDDCNFGGAE